MNPGAHVLVRLKPDHPNDDEELDMSRSGLHMNTSDKFYAEVLGYFDGGVMLTLFDGGKQVKRLYPWPSIKYIEVLEEKR